MKALIITPYTGDGQSEATSYRPLLGDILPIGGFNDITGNPLSGGIPADNLLVIEAEVTGGQLSDIKSDNRFFVLEPGPGYNGNALVTWLNGKGASGAGVQQGDAAETAKAKLLAYFKAAQ